MSAQCSSSNVAVERFPVLCVVTVERIAAGQADAAIAALADSFADYPVMQYVLGHRPDYRRRLLTLIGFFVGARVLRNEPVLGIRDRAGELAAVAIMTLPREIPEPEELTQRRERVWAELGAPERERYQAYGEACRPFTIPEPHHHLNMIGVRPSHAGQGLARMLLEAVHELALRDQPSAGVSLTTETPQNVPFYQHFGYRLLGHARVTEGLETWGFFRPNQG